MRLIIVARYRNHLLIGLPASAAATTAGGARPGEPGRAGGRGCGAGDRRARCGAEAVDRLAESGEARIVRSGVPVQAAGTAVRQVGAAVRPDRGEIGEDARPPLGEPEDHRVGQELGEDLLALVKLDLFGLGCGDVQPEALQPGEDRAAIAGPGWELAGHREQRQGAEHQARAQQRGLREQREQHRDAHRREQQEYGHGARGLTRTDRAPPVPAPVHHVGVQLLAYLGDVRGERPLQLGQAYPVAIGEEGMQQRSLVPPELPITGRRPGRLGELGQLPVRLACWQLPDVQVPAHRQVDDGGGDVDDIGALVDEGAGLRRAESVRWAELHRHRRRADERLALLESAPPTVNGVARNALAKSCRSTRMGPGLAMLPAGNATTAVSARPSPSLGSRTVAVAPSATASAQLARLPTGPAKHATRCTGAGPVISARPASIGTSHSPPITFQYSSSWSAKELSPPRTVYPMAYVCLPFTVRPGSPILRT